MDDPHQLEQEMFTTHEAQIDLIPFYDLVRRATRVVDEPNFKKYDSSYFDPESKIKVTTDGLVFWDPELRRPNTFDGDVWRAIADLIHEQRVKGDLDPSGCVFDLRELVKRVYSSYPTSQLYPMVRESLDVLSGVNIRASSFYVKEIGIRKSQTFKLISSSVVIERNEPDPVTGESVGITKVRITLDEVLLSNLKHNYVRPLSRTFLASLRKPIARRLYEILLKKLYGLKSYGLPLAWVIGHRRLCSILGLEPRRYFSQAKRTFNPSLDELVTRGFLQSYLWKESKSDWLLTVNAGPRALAEIEISIRKERGLIIPRGQGNTETEHEKNLRIAGQFLDYLGDSSPETRERIKRDHKFLNELVSDALSSGVVKEEGK